MKPYGNQLNLKKKVSYESKKNSEKTSIINSKLIPVSYTHLRAHETG